MPQHRDRGADPIRCSRASEKISTTGETGARKCPKFAAPPTLLVADVVRDRPAPLAVREVEQLLHVVGQEQLGLIVGKDQAVVAKAAGVPFVAQQGHEVLVVGVADQLAGLGPVLRVHLEAVDPQQVPVAGHLRHVVPGGVAGEGEEVEMVARQVDRPFQRALGVADGVVVVQVAPVEAMGGHAGLTFSEAFRRRRQTNTSGRVTKELTTGNTWQRHEVP